MNDPVTWMVNLITRLCINLGFMLGDGIRALVRGGLHALGQKRTPRSVIKAQKKESVETERIAGCRKVVLDFANGLGFIAREAMSREELEQKMNDPPKG